MKTLTEIKKVRCFNRLVLFVVALGLITTFTACSNDDDSDIPVYSLKDVDGNYSGTMLTESDPPVNPQTNSPKEEQPEGATVTAEVKDNQVMIKKLPVDDLIKSIVDEETAGIIIENLDDINYNIQNLHDRAEQQDTFHRRQRDVPQLMPAGTNAVNCTRFVQFGINILQTSYIRQE